MHTTTRNNETDMHCGCPDRTDHAVAIIGMASRFPQDADNNEKLWNYLLQARNAMTPFPDDRVNHWSHYHPDPEHAGTFHNKGGHFMKGDMASFDSKFFNLTNTEVATMDPQQRVLMENVYHALENAGIPLSDTLSSMTSVFVSGFNHDFLQLLNNDSEVSAKYKPTGMSNSILANRISWFYDFKAASLTVDTACSSSMVAFHLGCQSLRNRESEMAVVSGVNVLLWPNDFVAMSHHGFLSPDGKCYSFDHRANGYSRGEGVGTVILKRLSDAIRDGDTIRAVVRGTGVNQDGRTPGITLPNGVAQTQLIRDVYARAGIDPSETIFIESHGTGTPAGDPIEARAIAEALKSTTKTTPLYIGAMKSSIGHLEGAAGIASIIKSVMLLESGIIPPNTNFEKVNPKIPASDWNLQFPTQPIRWPTEGTRRISINCMGFGGTNAHVILDDAYHYINDRKLNGVHQTSSTLPSETELQLLCAHLGVKKVAKCRENGPENGNVRNVLIMNDSNGHLQSGYADSQDGDAQKPKSKSNRKSGHGYSALNPQDPSLLFMLSAFDEEGISRLATAYTQYFKTLPTMTKADEEQYMANLAYTLSAKRSKFAWKSFCVAASFQGLKECLETGIGLSKPVRVHSSPKLGFVFTGQGAQWYAMGRELLHFPVFRRSLESADQYVKSLGSSWSLLAELLQDKVNSNINQPWLAHPACTAIQIAVVDLLTSWNITPSRVVGHSSGEIAAAYCAGYIGRQAAWKIAYYRGIVSHVSHSTRGGMLAVGLSAADLSPYLARVNMEQFDNLTIACYNSPSNNTLSGNEAKIDRLKQLLDADSIFARKLAVSTAYHSSCMRTMADEYLRLMGEIHSPDKIERSEEVKMISSITGQFVDSTSVEFGRYWVENLVSPVNFTKALVTTCFHSPVEGQQPLSMDSVNRNVFVNDLVEIGPHSALQSAIKETIKSYDSHASIRYGSVLNRNSPGLKTLLQTVGYLSGNGYPVALDTVSRATISITPQMLVKLPPYEFNHSNKIWYESRITRNFRLRQYPNHDLLGAPVADWNVEEPRWRHIIRLSELPWIRDHAVTGSYIYPGVGYIAMAIEAAKQISDPKLTISGYCLRHISIKAALNIPDSKDGVEVMLHMARMDESSMERSKMWSQFRVMSYSPSTDNWVEHCTGYIAVEMQTEANVIDLGRNSEEEVHQWEDSLVSCFEACNIPLDMGETYESLSTVGLVFGPLFRNLSNVKMACGLGEATGIVTIPDVSGSMPKQHLEPHVVHPCVLDSMLHLFLASTLDSTEDTSFHTAMLPTYMEEVWVSSAISSSAGHMFRGHSKSTPVAAQKYESEVTIWDGALNEGRVLIRGLNASPLSNTTAEVESSKLCHTVEWMPDVHLVTSGQISKVTALSTPEQVDYRRQEIQDLQLATMLMITDALEELKDLPADSYEGHYQNYYQWLLRQVQLLQSNSVPHLSQQRWKTYNDNDKLKQSLYQEVAEKGPEGALCFRMGSNIARVLRKEVDPLHFMFGMDDLLDRIYAEMVDTGDLHNLTRKYLEILGHNHTDLSILEIGAGTGSSTAAFLEILNPLPTDGQSSGRSWSIAKYTYTDISTGFFEKAKERYKNWRSVLNFQTLNIEEDPVNQGYSKGEFDVVVAGNVLHATVDIRKTLSNVRSLLKPGGKLIMHEGIRQDLISMPVAFGQLAGWWLGVEPSRKWGPWISEDEWSSALCDAGFSGVELSLKDRADPELHAISVLVASAIDDSTGSNQIHAKILIITASEQRSGAFALTLVDQLTERYQQGDIAIVEFDEVNSLDLSETLCISLLELECGVLANPTEEQYKKLNYMLSTTKGLLWVTGDPITNPELNMISGLIRSIRWERDLESPNLVTLALEEPLPEQRDAVAAVVDIVDYQWAKANEHKSNAEYRLRKGVFFTNRLIDATEMNDWLISKESKPVARVVPLGQAEREHPLKLTTSAPGMLNKLQFETDPVWGEPLGELDVEVKIEAVGLNFRDIMIAMGQHNAMTFGNEGAGVVSRIGSAVKKVKVGDHVVYMDGMGRTGTFQTYGRVIEDLVAIIPKDMRFEVAASLPSVYVTAIYGLYHLANLQKGETVLIHSAAGGVGQAAIQLANLVGAEVFATVSTQEKANLLITKYGVKRDHIFSSRDFLFAKGIMRMTNSRGVDVILNSLAGEFLRRTWDCIAPFGRFIEIGKKDAQNNGRISLNPFLRNVVMASVELPTMMKYRPKQNVGLIEDTVRLYVEGKIKEPWPTIVRPYSQLEESFRTLQSGKGMGKFVLVPKDDALVPVVPSPPIPYKFKDNASFVLAGGLGGIGRSIARWMVSRGAKNIIFLSRSGAESTSAQQFIAELESHEVRLYVFACDVSDMSSLEAVIQRCRNELPPIKGCVQASMVLKDKIFENMSHENFRVATKPKVQGSWNLHTLLPKDMDFFILLSSVTGLVGNRGQANYAAGNTYQDALAAHRVSLGLPAVSLDLGTLLSVGYVAENRQRLGHVTHVASLLGSVREDQIHSMIELYLKPSLTSQQRPIQIASALTTATQYAARGMPVPAWMYMPLFTHLAATNSATTFSRGNDDDNSEFNIASALGEAASLHDAANIISDAIRTKLSKLLNMAVEDIDPTQSVSGVGVDSLVAVEFRTWLAKVVGADVPLLDILGTMAMGPTGLSTKLASVSKLVSVDLRAEGKAAK